MKNIFTLLLGILVASCANAQTIKDNAIVARMLAPETINAQSKMNVGLAASVSSNNLTVAIKQLDGSTNASALKPIKVAFRNATATTGGFTNVSITGALSMAINANNTMGALTATAEYVQVYLINNAGTAEIAAGVGTNLDEGSVISTTAISGGTTRGVFYSTTARSNVPARWVGRFLITQTGGNWNASPTEVSLSPLKSVTRSVVWVQSGNGFGSTNNKIPRFTNTIENSGGAITYADSASLGSSFTIKENGIYAMTNVLDSNNPSTTGISVNSNQLTTSILSITASNRLCNSDMYTNGSAASCSWIGHLNSGDVIRVHAAGTAAATIAVWQFYITQLIKM